MDWSTILGIIGIVVTVVIAFLVYHLQKTRKYPGILSVSMVSLDRVLGKKPKNYSDLSLRIGDYHVENNLLYTQLIFFNEKPYDIKADTNELQIKIGLPEGAKWVDVRVARQSKGINANVRMSAQDNSNCYIGFSLLRKGESVLLEGLVETANNIQLNTLFGSMSLTHRIPNVAEIERIDYPRQYQVKTLKKKSFFFGFYFLLFLAAGIVFSIKDNGTPLRFHDMDTGQSVSLVVKKDSSIVAYPSRWTWFSSYEISKDSLGTRLSPDMTYHRRYNNYLYYFSAILLAILFVSLLWEDFAAAARWNRISKYLKVK